ncbi:Ig-like domain repeat protein, partial [Methanobrevibacter millerae]|uniref:Ig-like domain repeat protein n=1 Tax=Methanobrevibacter millerae TaxID=230361 RepID=UPI0026ECE400
FVLNIVKANSTVLLDVFDTTTVDGLTAVATVNDDATGEVVFTLSNGESYTVNIINGAATLFLEDILSGEYNITAVYGGDDFYNGNEASASFKVTDVIISADDIKFAYKDPNAELVASVADENGNPLVLNLNVELNGENFTVTTGADGQAVIPLGNLTPGKYNAIISYQGLSKAASANALVTVTKAATSIDTSDVNIAYKDPSGEIVATIISEHGKGLAVNLNVEFNGKNYTVRTDSNGQAVIPVGNLTPGKYNAKISYKGSINYKASSANALVTVTKAATSIDAGDVNIAYRDPTGELVATVTNEHGKTLIVTVNIELNGKTYSVRTDANGQAVLSLYDVTPGTYNAKISYKGSNNYEGFTTTAKVVVTKSDTIISAPDVSVAYGDPDGKLVSTIFNEHGKPLVVNMKVELDGKTYSARSDSNGQINVSTADLAPGSYAAKISYKGSSNYNSASTTANITVKA